MGNGWGRLALAVGGVALIGAGVMLGVGWWSPTSAESDARVTQQIRTVRIAVRSGEVTVRSGDVSGASVHQVFEYHRRSRPRDAYQATGDQLVLRDCGADCTADFEVVVPRGTAVVGEATSGAIRVDDTGPVDVRATSGTIDVVLRGPQDVHARVTSGEIHLTVPNDRYRVTGDTTSGDRRIDVVDDPAAPNPLDVSTTSGDVTVVTG
jgi:hypothetical protein